MQVINWIRRNLGSLAVGFGFAVPLGFGLWLLRLPLNHDAAGFVLLAREELLGRHYGTDLFEVNPPLALWLEVASQWLGDRLQLSWRVASAGLWLVLLVGLWGLTIRILSTMIPRPQLALVILLIGMALFVAPGHSQHQREVLILASLLPYLAIAALRISGGETGLGLRLAAGSFLAVALCLKPYYGLVPLAVEAWLLMIQTHRPRWRSCLPAPEIAAAGLGVAVFALILAVFYPEFYHFILPTDRAYYHANPLREWPRLITAPEILPFVTSLAGVLLVIWLYRPFAARVFLRPNIVPLIRVLAVAACAALLAALSQGRGWDYHFVPARGLVETALLLGLSAILFARRPPRRQFRVLVVVILILTSQQLAPFPSTQPSILASDPATSRVGILSRFIADHTNAGDGVMVLSSSIYPQTTALVEAERRWTMPAMSLWLHSALHQTGAPPNRPEQMDRAEAWFFTQITQDFVKTPPRLILVDQFDQSQGRDFITYFNQDQRFAQQSAGYKPLGSVAGFAAFQRPD
ncbi:MAG: hypothetical protein ORO03_06975 [Alphaproteobacteria bacterium]|nr:hypothetical protein [Alphaproteobacteria bacterium]